MVPLGPDGLPLVEWIPLRATNRSVTWGLWCRRCGATKEVTLIPDGETAKTLLVDDFATLHASCDPPLK